ncbi:Ppx/GppA family phosphatase [Sphingomonas paeninsulae]|jgi:exopolyphosphatase/guanosine-5'-triphosphate,3'-diphosphate pyrophosphatase|uniref:Ppx/GppA family phosphatase n=1 Tax=Sphingomonas paeninsulae TaxID=2319844 RepID=A0A494TQX8_SPHPE|nr:Ppx/GppA family phosphatase [Sphingomonas paeninsulae]AYJ87525.1 Ppx/GppA family phosphatase [Sphingomonas paeninsulae]
MRQGPRRAIIDIGSNSIRLVVYDGPLRAPAILFNEKVMAGLGRGLGETGMLGAQPVATALRALERFRALTVAMNATTVRTVATAAVRDAKNGKEFLAKVAAIGLKVELLSGEAEATASGFGVISAMPEADGIVGDLGGGSLELVRISGGKVRARVSMPLGVLRLAAVRASGRGALDRHVRKLLKKSGWVIEKDLPFYLVGGSWRALARLHMHLSLWPLPILHGYSMPSIAAARMVRVLAQIGRKRLKAIDTIQTSRVPALVDAAALLAILVRSLESSALIVSAAGLREGLLFEGLTPEQRTEDPLIAAARESGARQGRFAEHGDLLNQWIAPLFGPENVDDSRLRHAACLLGDVAWAANPDFRAERGLEIALHGNWVGIDARGRAMVAQALFTSFGGSGSAPVADVLASPADLAMAVRWGLAMRLGQRLSGGVAGPLNGSQIGMDATSLWLKLQESGAGLYGEVVERRHRQLATSLGKTARLEAS